MAPRMGAFDLRALFDGDHGAGFGVQGRRSNRGRRRRTRRNPPRQRGDVVNVIMLAASPLMAMRCALPITPGKRLDRTGRHNYVRHGTAEGLVGVGLHEREV